MAFGKYIMAVDKQGMVTMHMEKSTNKSFYHLAHSVYEKETHEIKPARLSLLASNGF